MAVINGTPEDDVLTSDPVNGNGAGANTNNTFIGGDGDDVIIAGPAGPVTNPGHPNGNPYQDNDVLIGGEGNDILTGGYGNDKFVFTFTAAAAGNQVANTVYFRDGNTPNENADFKAWENYTKQLEAWREAMQSLHGDDQETDETFDVSITVHGGSAKKPSTSTFEWNELDNSFTWYEDAPASITASQGYDVITDFGNGQDKLVLEGLDADLLLSGLLQTRLINHDGDAEANDTEIYWNGGSIILLNYDMLSLEDALNSGKIVFDLASA